MASFAQKVAAVKTQQGELTIFFVGQAGYIIKTASGKLIGLDMSLTDCCARLAGFKRITAKILAPDELDFDYVIVSHDHPDHFDVDAIPILMGAGHTKLATSVCGGKHAEEMGIKENVTVMERGGTYKFDDFTIRAVYCDHGELAPYALGLILEIDGFKLFYAGDTAYRPEQVKQFASENFDVMMAPINGAFGNLNERECAEYSKLIGPKLTLPCHFWNFVEHGGDPAKFVTAMQEIAPDNAYTFITQGEYITVRK